MVSWSVGLDLGQSQDYTALVAVERVHVLPAGVSLIDYRQRGDVAVTETGERWREEFHVRAIRRWPLGTTYTAVVEDVAGMMRREPLATHGQLVVDRSGVGRAVVDLFTTAHRQRRMGRLRAVPLTITGGVERGHFTVPKNDLVDGLLVPATQGRVRVASGLPLGDALRSELLAFTQNITAAGRTTYDIERREGQGHGDIAMALMLALAPRWRGRPEVIEHVHTEVDA